MATPAYEIPVYVRGDLVQSTMSFFSDAAQTVPADPATVTATVKSPVTGLVTAYSPTKVSTGVYYVQVDTTPGNGKWVVHWQGTGTVQKSYFDEWLVQSPF